MWARDDAKLDRVRSLMEDDALDALVVRAPDNVLYLTNFWSMKGYDACVFPRDGEPVLICLEASAEDAARNAWTPDVRYVRGYDEGDPRPVPARTLEAALGVARGRVGLELSLGTQAADRMVGEPTTFTKGWFDAWPDAADATGLLARARMLKTEQEIARLRIANEIAAQAMHHVRRRLEPGMKESEAAALWQGFVHGQGTARDDVELALPFSLVWAGKGIKTFTATADLPVVEGEPVLFEIWVCADGYWADHTKNLVVGDLKPEYAELEEQLMEVYVGALRRCTHAHPMADLDRTVREELDRMGYPGQPTHPVCHGVGARAHEPPYPHQAGGGTFEEGMVLAVEPGDDWDAVKLIAGAGLRAQVWGFSRAVPADLEALVELGVPASVIESPISDLKLNAIGVDREKMLGRITDAMRFAAEHGIHAAFFGVDSTRAEPDFFERVYVSAVEAGAKEVVVVDTLGIASPEAVADLVGRTVEWVGPGVPVHFHGHNDFGLATAAAVAAVRAGATWVHGTINGMGERAGNANLGETALTLRALYGVESNLKLERIRDVSSRVRELSGYELEPW